MHAHSFGGACVWRCPVEEFGPVRGGRSVLSNSGNLVLWDAISEIFRCVPLN
jgi:hypothetical protein